MSAPHEAAGPFPRETPRLVLRRFVEADAAAFRAYRDDPEVARYQSWSGCTAEEAAAFVKTMAGAAWGVPDSWVQIAIAERAGGRLAGDCACHFVADEPGTVELGFTLARECQGRGYAGEAVAALLDLLLGPQGCRRVTASVDPRNQRSIRLLERLGFTLESHTRRSVFFKGEWCDDLRFALSREAWRARGAR